MLKVLSNAQHSYRLSPWAPTFWCKNNKFLRFFKIYSRFFFACLTLGANICHWVSLWKINNYSVILWFIEYTLQNVKHSVATWPAVSCADEVHLILVVQWRIKAKFGVVGFVFQGFNTLVHCTSQNRSAVGCTLEFYQCFWYGLHHTT